MLSRRAAASIVAVLTAVGAVLRLPGLDRGLWFDEIVTLVEYVRAPIHTLVSAYPGNNDHPFYSVLAHLSVAAFGEHVWSVRLPAYLFGVVGIPLLYRIARLLAGRTEAVLASLLLTVSYHDIWFSQNARGYTMLLFFTLLSTFFLMRLLRRPESRLAVAYGLAVAAGTYTHLTMAFVAVAHAFVWVWQSRGPREELSTRIRTGALAFGVAGIAATALYLPMLADIYAFFTTKHQATAAVATPAWAVLETLKGLRLGFGDVGMLFVVGLIGYGAVSYLRENRVATVLFVLPALVTPAAMVFLHAPLRPRFLFSLLGFGLMMLVRGALDAGRLVEARRRGFMAQRPALAGVAVTVVVAAVSLWSVPYDYELPKQDFDGALQFVQRHREASEPVATAGLATYPYQHFYLTGWTPIDQTSELDALRAGAARTWVVYSFPEYMNRALVGVLEQGCRRRQVFRGTLGGGDVIVCSIGDQAGD